MGCGFPHHDEIPLFDPIARLHAIGTGAIRHHRHDTDLSNAIMICIVFMGSRSFEQSEVDKIIAACLAKMGEVTFSDAYDEGKKMSLNEAVVLAVKE